ncbi:MAG: bifunctional folylpolyglutamate synthase/dihydrofolate synthase [Spirochaetes bacterium]|nr:bifunctional folylpolyglutamate synthase/dihydrofolate synthase [Spirochaetota bacterium]
MVNRDSDCFASSAEFFSWITSFANLERGQVPRSFSLDRMKLLCNIAGNPERCAPSIHIAGSKGKGSITVMTTSMLTAAGYRVARYMSPHVSDIRERVCLGDDFFDEAVYCKAGDEVRLVVDRELAKLENSPFDPAVENGEAPTFFELFTLFYFICARISKCDIMVIETGMGGRLDCTNVVDPLVSIISLIELEHTKFLGNTIPAVAGEKAGIIKPGKPVIVSKQGDDALEVFRKTAKERQSPLTYFPEAAKIENLEVHSGGTDFSLVLTGGLANGFADAPIRLAIPISGAVQAENAAISIIALKTVFPDIKDEALKQGLAALNLPARFELVSKDPILVIDGAHTPQSVDLCTETFRSIYGDGHILIFSCAEDKNIKGMAEVLLPHFSAVVITTPGTFKISEPDKIFAVFSEVAAAMAAGQGSPPKVRLVKDTGEAFKAAWQLAQSEKKALLCTGSFYLAAEVRNMAKSL